jgi:hypothetical protein
MDIMRENQEHNTAAIVVVGKGKKEKHHKKRRKKSGMKMMETNAKSGFGKRSRGESPKIY